MHMAETTINGDLRDKLALALDVDDLVAAIRLGRQLKDHFGVAKIGLELYSAAGPEAIGAISDLGYRVFLDLKLHDIPNTVERSARVLGALGVSYLTLHAHGGVEMMRAGVSGLVEGATRAGLDVPSATAAQRKNVDADLAMQVALHEGLAVEAGARPHFDLLEPHLVCPRMHDHVEKVHDGRAQ